MRSRAAGSSFAVGTAGKGDDHLTMLSRLAGVFADEEQTDRLRRATSAAEVHNILSMAHTTA